MLEGDNRSNFRWKSFGVLSLVGRSIRRWNFWLRWEDDRGIFVKDFTNDCKVMEHHEVINLTKRFHDLYIRSTWICYFPCHDERIVLLSLVSIHAWGIAPVSFMSEILWSSNNRTQWREQQVVWQYSLGVVGMVHFVTSSFKTWTDYFPCHANQSRCAQEYMQF